MSKDMVKQMFGKMEKDAERQKKYADLMLTYQRETEESMAEKLIELGKTASFAFSKDDLMAARAELMDKVNSNKELSDKDLFNVAGGGSSCSNKGYGITLSVLTAGIGCLVVSTIEDSKKSGGCGAKFSSTGSEECFN